MRTVLIAAALVVLTLVAYGPTKAAGIVYEDFRYLGSNQPAQPWREFWPPRPSRLLTWQMFAWQREVGVMPLHALNLGLHLLIVGLVWGVASSLGLRWPWFAAGLMALHPLSSQAVSYISGRADLVSTAGIALAVWAMLARWPAALRIVVGLLGVWVAVAGKESGVVVLPLLVLAGLARGYRLPASRWVAVGVVVALLIGSAVVGPKVAALNHRLTMVGTGGSDLVPVQAWAEKQAQATWIHVGHVVWPRALTVDHDVDASPFPTLALFLWLWVPVVAWLCWLVSPVVGFGVAWVWVCVALRLVVQTPMSYLAEHQFYGALIGVSLLASALVGGRQRVAA